MLVPGTDRDQRPVVDGGIPVVTAATGPRVPTSWLDRRRDSVAAHGQTYKEIWSQQGELQRVFAAVSDGLRLTVPSGVANDHEVDALICAVVARMARTGMTHGVPEEHREAARREGWIHLPVSRLADSRAVVADGRTSACE